MTITTDRDLKSELATLQAAIDRDTAWIDKVASSPSFTPSDYFWHVADRRNRAEVKAAKLAELIAAEDQRLAPLTTAATVTGNPMLVAIAHCVFGPAALPAA